jgi:hypothetical protein
MKTISLNYPNQNPPRFRYQSLKPGLGSWVSMIVDTKFQEETSFPGLGVCQFRILHFEHQARYDRETEMKEQVDEMNSINDFINYINEDK